MEYIQKREIAERLKDDRHIGTDIRLLARYEPGSSLHHRRTDGPGADTLSYDIIYALLNYVGEDVIRENRDASPSPVPEMGTQNTPHTASEVDNDAEKAQITDKSEEPEKPPVKKKMRSIPPSGGRNSTGRKSSGRN